MCSFLIKSGNNSKFEYFFYPECENTTNEEFIIYYYTSINKDKNNKIFTLRYTDSVSVIDETFEIINLATKLLFSNIPIEEIPKITFQDKYRAKSIHRIGKPIPYLES